MLKSLLRTWVRGSVLRKGLSGQSMFWAVIGGLGVLRNLKSRFAGKESTPFLSSPVRPGEVIELRYTGKPSRSLRKERRKKEALATAYAMATSKKDRKRLGRGLAGTIIPEIAQDRFGSSRPGALADSVGPTAVPVSGRSRRRVRRAARATS